MYDTDDNFTNRREPFGQFFNYIVPGIRIPSTTTGDAFLGGWEGTWTGLFEYDLLNRKRKFYTIKTIYKKHSEKNISRPRRWLNYMITGISMLVIVFFILIFFFLIINNSNYRR
jgi:hypothetical protein